MSAPLILAGFAALTVLVWLMWSAVRPVTQWDFGYLVGTVGAAALCLAFLASAFVAVLA